MRSEVNDAQHLVTILHVGHRRDVYRCISVQAPGLLSLPVQNAMLVEVS